MVLRRIAYPLAKNRLQPTHSLQDRSTIVTVASHGDAILCLVAAFQFSMRLNDVSFRRAFIMNCCSSQWLCKVVELFESAVWYVSVTGTVVLVPKVGCLIFFFVIEVEDVNLSGVNYFLHRKYERNVGSSKARSRVFLDFFVKINRFFMKKYCPIFKFSR